MSAPRTVLADRGFLEAPHWYKDELWLSDLHRHEIIAVSEAGACRVVMALGDQPSGLGFLPDGSAIVVSLLDRRVLRVPDGSSYADLTGLTVGGTNDMVVTRAGNAYVGSFGYDVFGRAPKAPGNLVLIRADGSTAVVAEDLGFPNGMAETADGTLLVAETTNARIVEFDVAGDGTLSGRRVWAELPGRPDGIALDREGAVWIAFPREGQYQRVFRGGRTDGLIQLETGDRAVSCGFGGTGLSSLYLTTSLTVGETTTSTLRVAAIDVPGAGCGW